MGSQRFFGGIGVVIVCIVFCGSAWVQAAKPATRPATRASAADLGAMLKKIGDQKSQEARIAHLDISDTIDERPADFSLFGEDTGNTEYSLLKRLKQAADDSKVAGVLITLRNADLKMAQAQELRDAMAAIKKPTFVYADSYTTATYILATGARDICILPGGDIEMPGVAVEAMFLRGMLDKIGVTASFVQIGDYKGADESFTRTSASPQLRGEMDSLVDSLYHQIVRGVAKQRNLGEAQVRELIDRAIIPADAAQKASLVDHVVDIDGLRDLMAKKIGKKIDLVADYGKERREDVDFSNPFAFLQLLAKKPRTSTEPAVAVVYIDGMIVSGDGSQSFTGSSAASDESIRKAMRIAVRDEDIKAVVLRIDSPGGSALASEAAWQAIRRVAKVKPVIVSVGHMAASGGYYIASAGEHIFADPSAIVGSIGVVGGKMALGDLYKKLGISVETFSRGANAAIFSSTEPFSDTQKQMMKRMMQQTYEQFIARIRTTRADKIADMDKVVEGRIFVGEKAVELGLVDEIGGMQKALDYAAEKGGLGKDYEVRILPAPKTLADVLSGGADAKTPVSTMQANGVAGQLAALPAGLRRAVIFQLLAAQELERRPVLLVPSVLLDAK